MVMVKQILRRTFVILSFIAITAQVHAQNGKYIADHKLLATILGEHYGIPSSVILAIATVESSGGAGPAAKVLHNHFGIVGKNSYVNHRGHSSRYKQYDNVYASYIDFCDLIARRKFYSRLKNTEDPQKWIKAISGSGYSESPEEWEQKVTSVLRDNKL